MHLRHTTAGASPTELSMVVSTETASPTAPELALHAKSCRKRQFMVSDRETVSAEQSCLLMLVTLTLLSCTHLLLRMLLHSNLVSTSLIKRPATEEVQTAVKAQET